MRSRNVCLTPELGADPGRVKDGGKKRQEKDSPHYRRQNEEREARQRREGVGILIPSQGQTAIGLFSGVGGKEICEKTYNAEKEKQRTRGEKGQCVPSSAEGSGKVHGCKRKRGRERRVLLS
ncbi:hypothetical protein QQF64_027579 [Cirrhinus molitorella]|uniref:Uncharacterized protein n=1 Tax=Cirrhinus molitorella TaxID=172907 RepID=A0ABR3NDK0_9TELE